MVTTFLGRKFGVWFVLNPISKDTLLPFELATCISGLDPVLKAYLVCVALVEKGDKR